MKYFKKIFHSHSGIALITVILILSILVAAALELNRSSRSDIYNAANIGDGLKLVYTAKSGFYAAAALLADSKREYETLRDDWAPAEILSAQSKSLFDEGSFIGRIDDTGWYGIELIHQIRQIYSVQGFKTEILAASIRNANHITQCAEAGADVCTCPLDSILGLLKHPLTDIGLAKFLEDAKKFV